jgi:hypothetical protein
LVCFVVFCGGGGGGGGRPRGGVCLIIWEADMWVPVWVVGIKKRYKG